jgi:hypothetical protein
MSPHSIKELSGFFFCPFVKTKFGFKREKKKFTGCVFSIKRDKRSEEGDRTGAVGERARGLEDASAPLGPRRRLGTGLGRRGWKPGERRSGSHPVQVGD